jgi:AraC-like DNA-binding protein
MISLVCKSGFQRDIPRSAAGTLSRLACARAREAGIDVAPLMQEAGVTRRQVEDDNIRLAVRGQIKFLALVAEAVHDDFLGFHLARDFDLREIGLLYYVFNSCRVLGDAFRRAERYSTIVNEGICLRVGEGKEVGATFTYVGVERLSDRQQIEFLVTSMVRMCRQLTNLHLLPSRVKLLHRRRGNCLELDQFMGCHVDFGSDTDEVVFPTTIKQLPIVDADPYLNKLLVQYCEEACLHRSSSRDTLRVDLENAIAPLLPHGSVRADEVARQLGLSSRTLARRLASEGLTFEGILSELRVDLAKRYLREEGLAISQIAWLVGYKEVSAFTHAFKRWTGKTPTEERAQDKARVA